MIPLDLADVADVVGGELLDPADAARVVDAVTIDSRTVRPGSLFVALPGEHVDGHDFVAAAGAAGAAGFLCRGGTPAGVRGGIAVDDPADALLGLGGWVRDRVDPLVVAVTGSVGKTTTTDLLRATLGAELRVVANVGSYNNELGVPLTCCELVASTQVLVAEVGARGAGHIRDLAAVLRPDVAVVTAVGAAHLEMFADVEGVARAKRELVEALGAAGVAGLNADDPRVAAMAAAAPGRVVTLGRDPGADVHATDVALDDLARPRFRVRGVPVGLPLPGAHNIGNALAALAVAEVCGVDPASAAAALGAAAVSHWRMELVTTATGTTILNDAYNANPVSTEAALRTLAAMDVAGRRWAVLGAMAELGAGSDRAHDDIGRLCARLGVDGLLTVGPQARAVSDAARDEGLAGDVVAVADADAAITALRERVRAGDAVLVKASRSAGLERVALALAGQEAP